MSKIKVVHYINQFFAQIGGEEKADYPAELRVGEIVGPGQALTQQFGEEAEIIATIVCGDSYFNENLDKAKADILEMVKSQNPDILSSSLDLLSMLDVTVLHAELSVMQYRKNSESRQ